MPLAVILSSLNLRGTTHSEFALTALRAQRFKETAHIFLVLPSLGFPFTMFNSPRHPGFSSKTCALLFANKGRKPHMPHCFGDKVEENWSTDWLFLYDSGGGVGWRAGFSC